MEWPAFYHCNINRYYIEKVDINLLTYGTKMLYERNKDKIGTVRMRISTETQGQQG